MQSLFSIAWLYWNPPKEVFTVPFIGRPIVWYGVLFVAGFILGYFLFVQIFTRFLKNSNRFSIADVHSWPKLIQFLQKPFGESTSLAKELLLKVQPASLSKIQHSPPPSKIDDQIKKDIVDGMNQLILEKQLPRTALESALPGISTCNRTAYFFADHLIWFAVLGTLIGARLGHVFFYDWETFSQRPEEIIKVWKGGLASHGGVIGVTIAIYLYFLSIKKWVPRLSFLKLLDFVAIPSALVACFIRLGNFMNQEIVGTPTTLPWAIVFGNAADGSLPIPRHPVQLYEGFAYLVTFVVLYQIWKRKAEQLGAGFLVGLLFTCIFGSRLILEFWKVEQSAIYDQSFLQMGQLLSIPFIIAGIALILHAKAEKGSSYCHTAKS